MKTILAVLSALLLSGTAFAVTVTFKPSSSQDTADSINYDAFDLNHKEAYKWGINWKLPANHVITGAKLTFENIWDWKYGEQDNLFIRLFDDTPAGLAKVIDNTADDVRQDYYDVPGNGSVALFNWSDSVGGYDRGLDLVLNFTAAHLIALTNFTTDPTASGKAAFGISFDPDCHYYNNGIKLYIDYEPNRVPDEGMTAALLALGLLGLALGRRFVH